MESAADARHCFDQPVVAAKVRREDDVRTKRGVLSRRQVRSVPGGDVISQLAHFFRRNGYARWQDARRVAEEGWQRYKKGDEVRLVADSAKELTVIRRLLREAGFRPGQPFVKGRQYRQPLYGREAVKRFLELVGERKNQEGESPPNN